MKPYRRITLVNVAVLVALCAAGLAASVWWEQRQAPAAAATRQHVGEIVQPVFREMVTPHGNLLEVRVPVDPLQIGVSSIQICYVWRDASTGGASLSCPGGELLPQTSSF